MICFSGARTISFDCSKIIEALERALGNSMAEERNNRIQRLIDALYSDDSSQWAAYEAIRAEEMQRHQNPRLIFVSTRSSEWKKAKQLESVQTVRQRANKQRRACSSERLPQSDIESIALNASQPVPPTTLLKGGNNSALIKGV